ncbi:outer membrane beta-barrel protein [Pricia sp. S334]|uniref:Outer membrane beta-barrel protein n=1 Tax=Pricia mediterranea TaxID=3076079 RepID=A0ABU3L3Y6_9FLAO|nr:outer membrane beta-barrel protein [Pricia sp. S334]MDT7828288.1 outer membrane beta-barrel protein [Pricia sp. S334]
MRIRISSTTAILLLCISVVRAQDITNKFRIGLSAGPVKNISSERVAFGRYTGFTADYEQVNYRVGLGLEYGLKSNLAITGAIEYSNKDFTGTYFCDVCDFEVPPIPEDVSFGFISVPVTFKYYFPPNRIRWFVEAGLNNIFPLDELDYGAGSLSFITGLKIAGGMEYNLGRKFALQLKIDYNNGMSRVFKDSDFKIKSLHLGIGIMKNI